jgi:hypothetical protein
MDKHCDGCEQKDRCREVYAKLGQSTGPNVAFKAVLAFVVPIGVFVVVAALVQFLLKNKLENATLIVLIQLAIGLAAAGIVVFVIRRLIRKDSSEYIQCPEKGKH